MEAHESVIGIDPTTGTQKFSMSLSEEPCGLAAQPGVEYDHCGRRVLARGVRVFIGPDRGIFAFETAAGGQHSRTACQARRGPTRSSDCQRRLLQEGNCLNGGYGKQVQTNYNELMPWLIACFQTSGSIDVSWLPFGFVGENYDSSVC